MSRRSLAACGVGIAATLLALWFWSDAQPRPAPALRAPAILDSKVDAGLPKHELPAELPVTDADATLPATEFASAEALTPAAPLPLALRVLRSDGTPALRARLAVYDDEQALFAEGDVDAQGTWQHDGHDGALEVFVRGVSPEIERFVVEPARGLHDLVLPEGVRIKGRVLIDGAPPTRSFLLAVRSPTDADYPWDGYAERPSVFRRRGEPVARFMRGVVTDAAGNFELAGIAPGTSVEILPSYLYEIDEENSTSLPVQAPHDDVVLALRSPPMLRGRIVDADGRPRPDAVIEVGLEMRMGKPRIPGEEVPGGSMLSNTEDLALDEAARFAHALGDPIASKRQFGGLSLEAFHIVATDPTGAWAEARVEIDDFTRDHDLGDLVLQPGHRWVIVVRDQAGNPVQDATVTTATMPIHGFVSRRFLSDADGRVELPEWVVRAGRANVSAWRYKSASVDLPGLPPPEPIEVVLARETMVTLTVIGPWGSSNSDDGFAFGFALAGRAPLYMTQGVFQMRALGYFAGSSFGADGEDELPEGWAENPSLLEGTRVKFTSASWTNQHTFNDLRAHHPLTLRATLTRVPETEGATPEGWLWEQDVWLEPGEQRVIKADLSAWRTLR
ncbi:MAG: hypothetical protein DHS20C15_28500 [Planctomycetota bacterium]|nr:MAG: hypothetical protein DHS20C15_28500 [Planctomycetota bacterium]